MVTTKGEPAQEETQNYPKHPLGVARRPPAWYFAEFGFLLGRLSFGGDHFVDHCFSICFATAQNYYFTILGIWAV